MVADAVRKTSRGRARKSSASSPIPEGGLQRVLVKDIPDGVGAVEVVSPQFGVGHIYCRGGCVYAAAVDDYSPPVALRMKVAGLFSQSAFAAVKKLPVDEIEEVAVRDCGVSVEQMDLVKRQVLFFTVSRVVGWAERDPGCSWQWREGKSTTLFACEGIDAHLLMVGVSERVEQWHTLERNFPFVVDGGAVPEKVDGELWAKVKNSGYPPEFVFVVSRVNGKTTIRTLAKRSGLTSFEVGSILAKAVKDSLITFGQEPEDDENFDTLVPAKPARVLFPSTVSKAYRRWEKLAETFTNPDVDMHTVSISDSVGVTDTPPTRKNNSPDTTTEETEKVEVRDEVEVHNSATNVPTSPDIDGDSDGDKPHPDTQRDTPTPHENVATTHSTTIPTPADTTHLDASEGAGGDNLNENCSCDTASSDGGSSTTVHRCGGTPCGGETPQDGDGDTFFSLLMETYTQNEEEENSNDEGGNGSGTVFTDTRTASNIYTPPPTKSREELFSPHSTPNVHVPPENFPHSTMEVLHALQHSAQATAESLRKEKQELERALIAHAQISAVLSTRLTLVESSLQRLSAEK